MLIKNLTIEKFKRWEKVEIALKPIDCLIGSNNSGKTSLLQALALFDFCVHHCLSGINGVITIAKRPKAIAPEDFYVIPCASPMDLWTDKITQIKNALRKISIAVVFDNDLRATAAISLSFNKFSVSLTCSDESPESLTLLRNLKISYLPVFSTFLAEEERKTTAIIEDALARGRVNSVIRNLLLDLQHNNRQELLLDVLRRIFPALEDITISFDEINDRYITFNYREQGASKAFDVFMAGSGFQQFVYLFGFIHLRQPTIILLDEPDAHLHGTLQTALLSELQRLVDGGKQVVLATHSREIIAHMPVQNIVNIENNSARRMSVAFDVYDALDTMGSLDPTQLPTIQAWRSVLIVEGETDWDLLSIFCEKTLSPLQWQETRRRLAKVYAHGNPRKQDMEKLLKQLRQAISLDGKPLRAFVICDRDYHPDPVGLRKDLPEIDHVEWHVWERTEIENYLLDCSAIASIVEKRDANASGEPSCFADLLRTEFDRLLSSSRDAVNDKLVKSFDEIHRKNRDGKDPSTFSREAREYLHALWDNGRIGLADAKEIVLPGIKRWLQSNGYGQFSNRALAAAIQDVPDEVNLVTRRLAEFVGVSADT